MKKYLTIFSLSFQNEFTYRFNFILWRVRNVLRLLMVYFLWNAVFSTRTVALGYTKDQMYSYVFLVLVLLSFVMSAPSNDTIGGEIASGDLSNYLVKPIHYLKYWLTRDMSSKVLNLTFSLVEVSLLWVFIKPQISLTANPHQLLLGFLVLLSGMFIYFFITKLAISTAFWVPENTWGLMFIILVFMETLSGVIFPLDVLSPQVQSLLRLTPFPYLIYYPITIFVGKTSISQAAYILIQSLVWLAISWASVLYIWRKGLKVYSAAGR